MLIIMLLRDRVLLYQGSNTQIRSEIAPVDHQNSSRKHAYIIFYPLNPTFIQ